MDANERGGCQHHHHKRGLSTLLAKNNGEDVIVLLRKALWHYKAAGNSDYLSEVHTRTLGLITKTGVVPGRWSKGLSVIPEKIAGVALVTKLRAILLMEADFNCHNRLIFGDRMIK